jgi:hypothetical protein
MALLAFFMVLPVCDVVYSPLQGVRQAGVAAIA